jgi:DNA polymerase elongation subunit (family B)
LSPNPKNDPIGEIEVSYEKLDAYYEPEADDVVVFKSNREAEIIEGFEEYIRNKDPDFLFSQDIDSFALPYLKERASELRLDLQLGREAVGSFSPLIRHFGLYMCPGRIALNSHYRGIPGLLERSRFSCLPPTLAGRASPSRLIDSRFCFELISRERVIPANRGTLERPRTLSDVNENDRGAMIISPKINEVHENVGVLDFEAFFPNLIITRNISPETIVNHDRIMQNKDAILPLIADHALRRRLAFKKRAQQLQGNSLEAKWAQQSETELKALLVYSYGTTGSLWSRFGSPGAFEKINDLARSVLIKAKDHAQLRGFEVIYGDNDSLFVTKVNASKHDYETLAREISRLVGLPMNLDHHFRFLCLLPLQGDPSGKMEAKKHYFGLQMNGEIFARGIEIRRHDSPKFIVDFQTELIRVLLSHNTVDDVQKIGYEQSLNLLTRTIDRVMTGELTAEDLLITTILWRNLNEYKILAPHVSAGLKLASEGKILRAGDRINYIYENATHFNPLSRAIPYRFEDNSGPVQYDREKYRDLLLDAAETVLGPFGFSREALAIRKVESFDWLAQLYRVQKQEALSEIDSE